ncbi:hypothetical protein L6452_15011 [Arctium lappa]|uniref:Uncharacterized protein n=1 Tax=Arctium lappa TaxID=4217 RepID=A0ACB9CML4_ARCLA|nr:hypothetical protein L6452_15011 [Arctium lappa]
MSLVTKAMRLVAYCFKLGYSKQTQLNFPFDFDISNKKETGFSISSSTGLLGFNSYLQHLGLSCISWKQGLLR